MIIPTEGLAMSRGGRSAYGKHADNVNRPLQRVGTSAGDAFNSPRKLSPYYLRFRPQTGSQKPVMSLPAACPRCAFQLDEASLGPKFSTPQSPSRHTHPSPRGSHSALCLIRDLLSGYRAERRALPSREHPPAG